MCIGWESKDVKDLMPYVTHCSSLIVQRHAETEAKLMLTQVNGKGEWASGRTNKCYECLLSYLFGFLFVHCTHWKFACCETVALYCVEVLRIRKSYSFPLRSYLFGRICECFVIGKVEFCVKDAS